MKTYKLLGYAGLIPFILCLYLHQINITLIDPLQAFVFYSAIIFSFISGSLWRSSDLTCDKNAQLISNILCLYSFVCLFLSNFYALLFLAFGYLILFIAEYFITTQHTNVDTKPYIQDYLKMRFILTVIVNILHSIAIFFLL